MALIPRTDETPEQRRYRILEEKLDQLAQKVEKPKKETKLPPATEKLPDAVAFASGFIETFRKHSRESSYTNHLGGLTEVGAYQALPQEIEAVGSACELLTDYFDRHNSRVLEGRKNAAENKEGAQESLPVGPLAGEGREGSSSGTDQGKGLRLPAPRDGSTDQESGGKT